MFWDHLLNELIAVVVTLLVSATVYGSKQLLTWMKQHKNTALRTLAELAYREIEANFSGVDGAQKLTRAIDALKQRIHVDKRFTNVSDDAIVKAIQDAWYQNEGQYKTAPTTQPKLPPG